MISGIIACGIMFFVGVIVGFWAAQTNIPSVSTNCKEDKKNE